MSTRNRFIILFLGLAAVLATAAAAGPTWVAVPPLVVPHQNVGLILWNSTASPIQIANTNPWRIVHYEEDEEVLDYSSGSFQWAVVIPPGLAIPWQWGQLDNSGQQVPPGDYYGVINWWYHRVGTQSSHRSDALIRVLGAPGLELDTRYIRTGETLMLTLRNDSPQDFRILDTAPWRILELDGSPFHLPSGEATEVAIPSGGEYVQPVYIDDGLFPEPGEYLAQIDYYDAAGRLHRLRDRFAVRPAPSGPETVFWSVTPTVNSTRSAVSLTLTNGTDSSIYLPSSAPWRIEQDGQNVSQPVALAVIVELPAGGSMSWPWDERTATGEWAPAGSYTGVVNYYLDDSYSELIDQYAGFELIDPGGACQFVTTGSSHYGNGEIVDFTYTNCLPDTVGMRGGATWWIVNEVGVPVSAPFTTAVLTRYAPNENFDGGWDQTDWNLDEVRPGMYRVVVTFTDKFFLTDWVVASDPFTVEGDGGSPVAPDGPPGALFTLEQNHPNPFNPTTVIRYEVFAAGWVQVRILDLRGRLVATLVDEHQEPGEQREAVWRGCADDDRPLPSGAYLCRMTLNGLTQTRKISLIR